jgi:hypothetical protein
MQAARVEEAPSSEPRRLDEIDGVDDERIPLPGSYAVPIVRGQALRPRVPLATIREEVAEFRGPAAVVGIRSIEEDDVFIGLDDPPGVPCRGSALTLAGTGITTYICAVSVSVVVMSRVTAPFFFPLSSAVLKRVGGVSGRFPQLAHPALRAPSPRYFSVVPV